MELVFRQGLFLQSCPLSAQYECISVQCVEGQVPTGSSTAWNMGSNRMGRCPVTTHQWRGQLLIPDFTTFLEKVRLETMYPMQCVWAWRPL